MKTHGSQHNPHFDIEASRARGDQFRLARRAQFQKKTTVFVFAWIVAILLAAALAGCSAMVPTNKTTSTASAAQDKFNSQSSEKLKSVVTGRIQPAPIVAPANRPVAVTVSGKGNVVTIPLPEVDPLAEQVALAIARGPVARTREVAPTETVEYESTSGQSAASEDSASTFSKVKMPMSVALFIGAIALGMLCTIAFLVIKYIKSTGAGAAALSLADNGLAKMISAAEAKLMASTEPREQAAVAMHLSELNKERGKLALNMQPPKV